MTTRLLVGHVLEKLRELPDESVHCVITSPPYWGLRSYGTEHQVWGGDPDCDHLWGEERKKGGPAARQGYTSQRKSRRSAIENVKAAHASIGCWCQHCGAWRGEHGQEPTIDLWLENEVEIFREVRRVLRADGTLWLNIGDAYATQPNGRSAADQKAAGTDDRTFRDKPVSTIGGIFKDKDRLGLPHRLAFALQADGWWLRDEIIWSKANPMPSSIKDRTCPAHEFMFTLSKAKRYFYDYIAIMEPFADERQGRDYKQPDNWASYDGAHGTIHKHGSEKAVRASERNRGGRTDGFTKPNDIDPSGNGGRMKRSVWHMALEPFAEAHFATFPTELVKPCILAGTSAKGVCPHCGAPWQRIVRKTFNPQADAPNSSTRSAGQTDPDHEFNRWEGSERGTVDVSTLGWYPSCSCYGVPDLPAYPDRPKGKGDLQAWEAACAEIDIARAGLCADVSDRKVNPATVLDPFGGSGTTALVADLLGRDAILTELNPTYAEMARKRIRTGLGRVKSELPEDRASDLPLFAEVG